MRKMILKRKDDEPLHAWIDRLADYYAGQPLDRKALHGLLREVSWRSYVDGSNSMYKLLTDDNT